MSSESDTRYGYSAVGAGPELESSKCHRPSDYCDRVLISFEPKVVLGGRSAETTSATIQRRHGVSARLGACIGKAHIVPIIVCDRRDGYTLGLSSSMVRMHGVSKWSGVGYISP